MTSFQDRMDMRKKNFKKGLDAEDTRRRREDESVQIRKAQKEAQLSKKRMFNPDEAEVDSENVAPVSQNLVAIGAGNSFVTMVQQLAAGDQETRLSITQDIRRAVAKQHDPPIQEAIDAGVIPAMVAFLQNDDTKLQFEAAWVLTNIASGDTHQTQAVVDGGAIGPMVKILQHGQPDAQEQVVWAVSNIAGDSAKNRDGMLSLGVVGPMLQLMVQNEGRIVMLRNVTWALSNLCRGKPSPQLSIISPMIPYLARLVSCNDAEVCADACWAFSYITDIGEEAINAVLQSGALSQIVSKLDSKDERLLQPALRAAGNIATGSDMQTTVLLQHGVLDKLKPLLSKSKRVLRKETVWLISNVTAGNIEQNQLVMDAGLFPSLMKLCSEGTMDVRKECVWALSNAGLGAGPEQLEQLARMGVLGALVAALSDGHAVAEVQTILDSLSSFLFSGKKRAEERGGENVFCGMIEECGGLTKLEELQEDASEAIYTKAVKLLTDYFNVEEDAETPKEAAPADFIAAPAGGFNFNGGFNFGA